MPNNRRPPALDHRGKPDRLSPILDFEDLPRPVPTKPYRPKWRTIIAGGRDYFLTARDKALLVGIAPFIDEVVSGKASGADRGGEIFAEDMGLPVKPFPARWQQYGKRAGPIRNEQMAGYADALVVFPGGYGTSNMVGLAARHGLWIVDTRDPRFATMPPISGVLTEEALMAEVHTCHASGCTAAVAPRFFMCRRHWGMVPQRLKGAIWREYRPGQEIDKTPSPAYVEAARAAIDAVRAAEDAL